MASFNQIQLLGNVGRVDVKTFSDGGKITTISLATSETYKDRAGEKREETQWHNVVCRGNIADIAERYVHKGDPVFVTGMMKYRRYNDRDGNDRSIAEVQVTNLQLLTKGNGGGRQQAAEDDDLPDFLR